MKGVLIRLTELTYLEIGFMNFVVSPNLPPQTFFSVMFLVCFNSLKVCLVVIYFNNSLLMVYWFI